MATEIVKQRAYEIDPECWLSCSGAPLGYKQRMVSRRVESLRKATAEVNGTFDTRPAFEIWWESYIPEDREDIKQIALDAWNARGY